MVLYQHATGNVYAFKEITLGGEGLVGLLARTVAYRKFVRGISRSRELDESTIWLSAAFGLQAKQVIDLLLGVSQSLARRTSRVNVDLRRLAGVITGSIHCLNKL